MKTQADALQDAITTVWEARTGGCLDGIAIADIRAIARLIDSDVGESTFEEHGEQFRTFMFPADGSAVTYADSDALDYTESA